MLDIALCEDNELQLELFKELLYDYNSVSAYRINVSAFSSGAQLLDYVEKNGRFDIYILDIIMPEMDGMELSRKLREKDETGKIVFLTSETSFVYKAFSVNASGYLVKPINPEDLFELIDNLRTKIEKEQPSFVTVSTEFGDRRVEVKDILFVDTEERIPIYHLTGGSTVIGKSRRCKFQEMISNLLNGHHFVLSSVGVAVNLENVAAVKNDKSEICLKDGTVLLCSRTMKENFNIRLNNYWNH